MKQNPKNISRVIIHMSETPDGKEVPADVIRSWHIQRGWDDIGYHFVVQPNGTIEMGRQVDVVGAHTKGRNTDSVGICWVGGYESDSLPTVKQIDSMKIVVDLIDAMTDKILSIYGHCDFDKSKRCPNFDVDDYNWFC